MAAIEIPLERLLDVAGARLWAPGAGATRFTGAAIDGRAVTAGGLFFAVRGERFDGHDFIAQAVASGAAGLVVARGRGALASQNAPSATVVEVEDPVAALGQLGRAQRQALPQLRVAAVTGSVGKTTTKEMLAAILAAHAGADAVLKTEGNLNNHLGVPLTLLRLTAAHRYAVVELGMSALGEIDYLASLALPEVGVVVSVRAVHLEQLGTLENVARAKGEIWKHLGSHGRAVAPVDEPRLLPHLEQVPAERRLTFGRQALHPTVGYDEVRADPRGLAFRLHLLGQTSRSGVEARMPLVGAHLAEDAAAAAAAALALGVGEGSILDGLAAVRPGKHRGQLVELGGRTLFDDCYNASPASMRAALDALVAITPAGRQRIAVLGDMLELGPDAARLHAEVGAYAAERVDRVVAVGPLGRHLAEGARPRLGAQVVHVDDAEAAAEPVAAASAPGDVVLVKGSRGMRLERVLDALAERFSPKDR